MRMRGRSLTPEEINVAVGLYDDGISLARIGQRLDTTARTVQLRRLRERGITMRDTHGRPR